MKKKTTHSNRKRPSIEPKDDHELEGLLLRDAAAKYLQVAPTTLLRWTRLGKVDHVRKGRTIRYTKAGLDRWIAKHTAIASER